MVRTVQKAEEMILRVGKNKRGFLLLEVMISAAILSVCLVLIIGSFTRALKAIDFSEDYFRAGLLLEGKIYELSSSEIEEGFFKGIFAEFDNGFSWDLDVVELEDDPFREVSLRVSWDQGTIQHDISIVTYL